MARLGCIGLLAGLLLASSPAAAQTTLRIGLAEDPDVLDPTLARTYVGRIVFASLCDKLFDIDDKLNIVPQLALSHETSEDGKTVTIKLRPGVKFHDGEHDGCRRGQGEPRAAYDACRARSASPSWPPSTRWRLPTPPPCGCS